MIQALKSDREIVVDILTNSFDANKSVLSVVKGGRNQKTSIRRLMQYAFDLCMCNGEIFLSNDKTACALILFPARKRLSVRAMLLDLKLLLFCTGFNNAQKALQRDAAIRRFHPKSDFAHLWFLGVLSTEQHKGHGSAIMQEIMDRYCMREMPIYLETSTLSNISWYQKHGFTIVSEIQFDYTLFIFKREFSFCHALTRN